MSQPSPPQRSALVADDDVTIRALLTEFLEQLLFRVRVVPDGQQALNAVYTERFDVILLDFQMPGMTGVEAALEIRKVDPHVPIALITGSAHALNSTHLAQARITRTFLKPFDLEELSVWLSSLGRTDRP